MAASAQVITDSQTVITTGPTANTQANSIAPAGPIMDYVGNTKLLNEKFKECKVLLAKIIAVTDAGDGSLTTLQNILLTLS